MIEVCYEMLSTALCGRDDVEKTKAAAVFLRHFGVFSAFWRVANTAYGELYQSKL